MEEEEARDLSPLTVLFLGCLVAALVFKMIERIYLAVAAQNSKRRFKRRTREEEEMILRQQQQQQQAEEEEEEEEMEEEEGMDQAEGASLAVAGPLTKRDLAKIAKKREKQERQEAHRAFLQHERELRALREKEELEREEFERNRYREKMSLVKPTPMSPAIAPVTAASRLPPTEEEVQRFFMEKRGEITFAAFHARFPQVTSEQQRNGLIDRFIKQQQQRRAGGGGGGQVLFIPSQRESILRVEQEDLDALRQVVRERGSVEHVALQDMLHLRYETRNDT